MDIFSVCFPFQFLIEGNAQVCEFTDHLDIGTTYGDVKVCDGFQPLSRPKKHSLCFLFVQNQSIYFHPSYNPLEVFLKGLLYLLWVCTRAIDDCIISIHTDVRVFETAWQVIDVYNEKQWSQQGSLWNTILNGEAW